MPTYRLLILMLVMAVRAAAQEHSPNEIASSVRVESRSVPAVASVPVAPFSNALTARKARVFDKRFVAVMGALGGAESFRFTSRKLVLDNEFAAGAPWVTRVPPNQHIIVKDGALFAAELLAAYEIKKRHSWLPGDKVLRKLWWAYPATMTTIHLKNAISNVRTQGPGGCTSIECAEQTQMQ